MTERGRRQLRRDRSHLGIGPSSLVWEGDALSVEIDELCVPLPSRVRGRVRVRPQGLVGEDFALDPEARHRWRPLAPRARIEVELSRPALRWQGTAYLDTNRGVAPLEDDFVRWHWSRGHLADGSTAVLYEATPRSGEPRALAIRCAPGGGLDALELPPRRPLGRTGWGIARETRAETARVLRTLEDTPFYARSLVEARLAGEVVPTVHESLCLDRFRRRWVQALLPFRMPRRK